jgi:hypothetical protein
MLSQEEDELLELELELELEQQLLRQVLHLLEQLQSPHYPKSFQAQASQKQV